MKGFYLKILNFANMDFNEIFPLLCFCIIVGIAICYFFGTTYQQNKRDDEEYQKYKAAKNAEKKS